MELLSSTASESVSLLQCLLTQEWFWFYLSKGAGIVVPWLPLLSKSSHNDPVSSLLLSLIYLAANTSILLEWQQHCLPHAQYHPSAKGAPWLLHSSRLCFYFCFNSYTTTQNTLLRSCEKLHGKQKAANCLVTCYKMFVRCFNVHL